MHPRIAALLLGSSLLTGCVDAGPAPATLDQALAALPDGTRDALLQAGATAVELGSDQRPLLVRFAGLAADDALSTLAQLYGVSARDLALTSSRADQLGMRHQRFQQMHGDLPVIGAELSIHSDARGDVVSTISTLRTVRDAAPPTVGDAAAESLAAAAYPRLGDRTTQADGLAYVVDAAGEARLCRIVWVRGQSPTQPVIDQVFIDAATGEVVTVHPQVHTAQNRRTHTAGGTLTLPGTLRLSETQTTSGDTTLDTLHANAGKAHRCALTLFGRDGFDGAGATITSTGHYDQALINAFWDGTQLAFGDGDGQMSAPLVSADIVAHEFAHAVTQYTAGLVYQSQSGALNESMSDVFSSICDIREANAITAKTWNIGEDIWTPATPGDALRYMANPTQDQYSKDHTSVMTSCTVPAEDNDYCYVHGNSGLPNLAFKLLVTGGLHPRGGTGSISSAVQVPALGITRAQAITYRAWTTYLAQNSNFVGARAAFDQAARDLYPNEPGTLAAVNLAWHAVGVGATVPNLPTGVGDPNAGPGPGPGPGPDPDPTDPDPTDPDPTDPDSRPEFITGGCSTGSSSSGFATALTLLGLVTLVRRRRVRA